MALGESDGGYLSHKNSDQVNDRYQHDQRSSYLGEWFGQANSANRPEQQIEDQSNDDQRYEQRD